MIVLEKTTEQFIQSLAAQNGPPIYKLSIEEARALLDQAQKGGKRPPAEVEDTKLGGVSVRIIRPPHAKEKLPTILYCHGGGWILGNKETHDRLVRELALGVHAEVIFVNYTPSPEAKFPIAIEEAFSVLKAIQSDRIAVAGDSVGGNMAAVLTLLAKERGIKIKAQALFYPVTDASFNTGSYRQFAEGPWLTKPAMEWFWNAYLPSAADRKKTTASPLHTTLEQLHHLPPALILTAENDVLRDEGEAYSHKLIQAGVDVVSVRYLGTIHDFMMLNALSETPAAKSGMALAIAYLKEHLSKY